MRDKENGRPWQDGRSENITCADTNRPAESTADVRRKAIAERVCCDEFAALMFSDYLVAAAR
jgi:hypothetical protein